MPLRINNILNKKNSICRLSFFLCCIFFTQLVFAAEKDTVYNKLTVIKVTTGKKQPYSTVAFTPSQRLYKVLKGSKKYTSYINLLKWSAKYKQPVIITRRTEYSDTIVSVKKYKVQ